MPSVRFHIDIDTLSPYVEAAELVRYPNGMTIGPRRIYGYEVIAIASGRYDVDLLDRRYSLAPGDVFIMPPNVTHRYRCASAASHYYVYFHLSRDDKRRRDRVRKMMPTRHDEISLSATYADVLPFHYPSFPGGAVHLFRDIAEHRNSLDVRTLAASELACKSMVIALIREIIAASAGGNAPFHASVRYIDAHFAETISVEDLAGCEGLTPNYFSTRFKAAYGVAPMTYLAMRRITAAKELIRSGLSVRETARRTGFRDQYYFSNVFRRIAGLSPSEFRALDRTVPV